MQLPNLSLAYLVAELKPVVEGAILRKVQELENNWVKIRLQTKEGSKDLIAAPQAMFLTNYSMPARQETSGYGAFLRKHLSNKRVVSFQQHSLDRIVVMEFEDFSLIFELFAKGNVILADKKMEIVSAFRKEQWKDRALKKGQPYRFPSSKGASPLELDEKGLAKMFKESNLDAVRALVKEVNIAPIFAEAACAEAGIEKAGQAAELNAKQLEKLHKALVSLYSVDLKREKPLLAELEGKQVILPFPLKLSGIKVLQCFETVNAALDAVYSSQLSETDSRPEVEAVEKKKAELQGAMRRQQESLEALQQKVEANTGKAELIYANYAVLFELLQAVKSLEAQKLGQKEIMYKLGARFPFLKSLDLQSRKLVVSLEK